VAQAREGRENVSPCVPLRRGQIISAADELLALAAKLSSAASCPPRPAALASFLLYDARSPLYFSEAAATPASIARAALAGLETSPDSVPRPQTPHTFEAPLVVRM
jgi:hypothetical protein